MPNALNLGKNNLRLRDLNQSSWVFSYTSTLLKTSSSHLLLLRKPPEIGNVCCIMELIMQTQEKNRNYFFQL